jgi:ABC-type lipoprotein release transport system permease subunit
LLVGIQPLDAVSFVTAAAVLGVVLLAACLIPAHRAAAADPAAALRAE